MLSRKRCMTAGVVATLSLVVSTVAVGSLNPASAGAVPFDSIRPASGAKLLKKGAKPGPSLKFVVMGDSYSAGNGAGSYIERDCWRSTNSYGAQVAARMGATVTNVACSGGVVNDLLTARPLAGPRPKTATYTIDSSVYPDLQARWKQIAQDQALCGVPAQPDIYSIYDVSGLSAVGDQVTATSSCQMMAEPQINAVNPSTTAVFVTIGGNDIGFSTIVVNCLVARNAFTCKNTIDAATVKVAELTTQTKAAALAVHKKSKGKAEIYLLGYPFLINTADYSIPEAAPVYNAGSALHDLQVLGDATQEVGMSELNAFTRTTDFHFVDVKPTWGQHTHGLDPRMVSDQSQSWIVKPFAPGTQLVEWAHPTLAGWTATAEALYQAILN